MRDPEATRRRLLDAATAEFAAYGIAGARVDRIAETAGCNKQSIYGHFNSKEGLFDAVYDAMVVQTISSVVFEAADLPAYAGRLFDWYSAHPEVLRLATWQQLERGPAGAHSATTAAVTAEKIGQLRAAQQAGTVSDAVPAELLLLLIVRLSTAQLDLAGMDPQQGALLRLATVEAVRRLVQPVPAGSGARDV